MDRQSPKAVAVVCPQNAGCGLAQPRRFLQHRVPDWREVAGRGIDDLQDLRGRGLLSEGLVALDSALGELASKVSNGLLRIG
jgi:hypothetical protein